MIWNIILTYTIYKKNKKYEWFPAPTQLFIHGQWWSYTLTHLLQYSQCLLLNGLAISQSLHILLQSFYYNNSNKLLFLFYYINPGFFNQQIKNNIITNNNILISVYIQ